MCPEVDFDSLANLTMDNVKNALSTSALYLPKAGGQISIRGPFDDRVQEADPDTEIPISSNMYTFGLKLADLPSLPEKGDKIIISEVAYRVIEIREDGMPGVSVVLIMHRVVKK